MGLPVITLAGTPHEQGRRHGRLLRDRIAENIKIYFDRFEAEGRLSRSEALDRANAYGRLIERLNPEYAAGMAGVADGTGIDLREIIALNVRYEILYHQLAANARTDGCTAFAISPAVSANGHLLLGQNWDWIPEVQGALLRTTGTGGIETLSFTEAGVVGGKIGLNSAGLGLAINGLHSTADDWSRLRKPFHVRCHEILRSVSLEAAANVVIGEARACSTNFLIAQLPDRVTDVEAAPDAVRLLQWEAGRLVHTNHFIDPSAMGVTEPALERVPHSQARLKRFRSLLRGRERVSVEDLGEMLRDHDGHPYSVCRHPDPAVPAAERYKTVASIIMDLDERSLSVTDGPPCGGTHENVLLDSTR